MAGIPRSSLLFSAGGDVLAKYGTLTRRYQLPAFGGEGGKETFTRSGTATYISRNGNVLPAAANLPRAEWQIDPVSGLSLPYLLMEGAATNSCLQSETIDNATWTKTRTSVTANNTVCPDGINSTADKLVEDASVTTTHTLTQPITITSGENVAVSIYAKASTRSRLRIQFGDTTTTNGFNCDVNLGAGTITAVNAFGAGTGVGQAITALGNGWFRLLMWGRVNAAVTAGQLFVLLEDNSGNPTYTGDGASGLFLWGAQVERNGTVNAKPPTSYTGATVAATVTRNAETFQCPFYTQPQGGLWMYARFIERGTLAANAALGGNASGASHALFFTTNTVPLCYEFFHFVSGGPATGSLVSSVTPTYGQLVELLGIMASDGSVTLRQAINGGADVVGAVAEVSVGIPAQFSTLKMDLGFSAAYAAFGRLMVGIGGGTFINTIADARAVAA